MPSTAPNRYALGRNSTVAITPYFSLSGGGITTAPLRFCVSSGSIEITSDITEIPNNCNSGWKTKLAGNKSSSFSFTGYVASGGTASASSLYNPMNWIGQELSVYIQSYDGGGEDEERAMLFSGFGVASSARFSIDANDAVKAEITIEINRVQSESFSGLANSAGL